MLESETSAAPRPIPPHEHIRRFCADADARGRDYLIGLLHWGAHTYASDGIACARVARVEGSPEATGKVVKTLEVMANIFAKNTIAGELPSLTGFPLPPPVEPVECKVCEGRGSKHECPDCECGCARCGSSGMFRLNRRVQFKGGDLSEKYVRALMLLPDVRLAFDVINAEFRDDIDTGAPNVAVRPVYFTFTGGEGVIAGMRKLLPEWIASKRQEERDKFFGDDDGIDFDERYELKDPIDGEALLAAMLNPTQEAAE